MSVLWVGDFLYEIDFFGDGRLSFCGWTDCLGEITAETAAAAATEGEFSLPFRSRRDWLKSEFRGDFSATGVG